MPAAPELCDDLEELAGECQVLAQDCEQVAHRLERHDWGTADLLYEQAGEWHLSAQQYLNHAYLPGA